MNKTTDMIKRRKRKEFSGRELERARLKAKVTVSQLAKVLGVTRGMVYQLEAGQKKPSVDLLADIARTLNVSIESFFD